MRGEVVGVGEVCVRQAVGADDVAPVDAGVVVDRHGRGASQDVIEDAAAAPDGPANVGEKVVLHLDSFELLARVVVVRAEKAYTVGGVTHDVVGEGDVLNSAPWRRAILIARGEEDGG